MLSLDFAEETTVPLGADVPAGGGDCGSCVIWLGGVNRAGSAGEASCVASLTCIPFSFNVDESADWSAPDVPGALNEACWTPELAVCVAAAAVAPAGCHVPEATWVLLFGLA